MAYRKIDNPQKRADPLGVGGKHWNCQTNVRLGRTTSRAFALELCWNCAGTIW